MHRINPTTLPSTGLLALRGAAGVVFAAHGLDKLSDPAAAEAFFASLGIPAAGVMAPLVAVLETAGGALLLAGLATPLVATVLTSDMIVAILTAHLGRSRLIGDGGLELPLLLGAATACLGLVGAGRFSLDTVLGVPRRLNRFARLAIMRPAHAYRRTPSTRSAGSPE